MYTTFLIFFQFSKFIQGKSPLLQ